MKVFAVLGGHYYGETLISIHATRESAKTAANAVRNDYDDVSIEEHEVKA